MSIRRRIKVAYSVLFSKNETTAITTAAGEAITSKLFNALANLTDIDSLSREEMFEQFYMIEPEAGGSADRISSLVRAAYKGFTIASDPLILTVEELDNIEVPDETDKLEVDEKEKKMLSLANMIGTAIEVEDDLEAFTEILASQGNLYLEDFKTRYVILPNTNINLVDDMSRIGGSDATTTITDGKILVIDESKDTQRIVRDFIHVKYKKTPVHIKDSMNRETYGVYSPSPYERALFAIWQARQITMIDLLWRNKNVPREHHIIKSEPFSYLNYEGTTISGRQSNAESAALTTMTAYKNDIASKMPDQGYVSLDNVDIKPIQFNPGQMKNDDILRQLSDKIWVAMNMSKSIVNGDGSGTYAGELIISSYITSKIEVYANKVKKPILRMVRNRILEIDPTLPVTKLDMEFKVVLASSSMEIYRQFAIMVDSGLFTINELREIVDALPISEKDYDKLYNKDSAKRESAKTIADSNRELNQGGSPVNPDYPNTPQSQEGQIDDRGQQISDR